MIPLLLILPSLYFTIYLRFLLFFFINMAQKPFYSHSIITSPVLLVIYVYEYFNFLAKCCPAHMIEVGCAGG